jgi:CBS domain-containing protein
MLLVKNAMRVGNLHISPEASLREAAELMIKQGVDALPVVEQGRVVGIVRLADLLTAPRPAQHEPRVSEHRDEAHLLETWRLLPVRNIMNEQIITVTEDTSLMKAVALMVNHGRQRLPVVRSDLLVGLVSRTDIVRTLLTAERREAGLS